jgi:DNA-binding MarR family transcriptional regulator
VIGRSIGIGRAAAGHSIDRLEKRGYVERLADPNDRRIWLVNATPAGRELTEEISAIDARLRQQLRIGIDRHERQMLASLLVRIQRNLKATDNCIKQTPGGTPK